MADPGFQPCPASGRARQPPLDARGLGVLDTPSRPCWAGGGAGFLAGPPPILLGLTGFSAQLEPCPWGSGACLKLNKPFSPYRDVRKTENNV